VEAQDKRKQSLMSPVMEVSSNPHTIVSSLILCLCTLAHAASKHQTQRSGVGIRKAFNASLPQQSSTRALKNSGVTMSTVVVTFKEVN